MPLEDFGPRVIRPNLAFRVSWEGKRSEGPHPASDEYRWMQEAMAEVDAICTSLRDWKPRA